ncbi:MAG: tRNA (cytidine(34)-2'-O)-methyltransferase [Bdellovibrionota bacterium]|nr:tRNA (cytidine(34)-2'-O)-methyltransferase [Bdellovibrionota bacterium]
MINIVLVEPEIPGNTGSLGRTALALGARLHLIHPLGFDLNEKSVRRAGLDYWKHVDLTEHQSYEDFLKKESPKHLYFFTAHAKKSLFDAQFNENSYLVFGKESKGLPQELCPEEASYKLPILSPHIRSLNLASCATAAAYECYRQNVPG